MVLVEPDREVVPATPGTVVGVTDKRVMMQVGDTIIIYDNLKDVRVKLNDVDPTVLGLAGDDLMEKEGQT